MILITFFCNCSSGCWLAVDEEDGKIERVFPPADDADMVSFKNLFESKISKDLFDKHLWLSVVYRPPRSRFTRVQRLTCCLSLLCTAMVASAMFYGAGPEPGDTSGNTTIGPIQLNWKSVMIGIQSILVVLPINLLIVYLFRNYRPEDEPKKIAENQTNEDEVEAEMNDYSKNLDTEVKNKAVDTKICEAENQFKNHQPEVSLPEIVCEMKPENEEKESNESTASRMYVEKLDPLDVDELNKLETENDSACCITETETQAESQGCLAKLKCKCLGGKAKTKSNKPKGLPYWTMYVGYVLCFVSSVTSALFTLFYSMMWGKEKSNLWLSTMMVAFIQDTFISQPIKMLFIALFFALVIKKPTEEDEDLANKRLGKESRKG